MLTLDKGYNQMSKFLNKILGIHVEKQNLLFKYFSDTLAAIISLAMANRSGRYDQGILDVGLPQEDHVELVKTHSEETRKAERGMSWEEALEKERSWRGE